MIDTIVAQVDWDITNWFTDDWVFSERNERIQLPTEDTPRISPKGNFALNRKHQIRLRGPKGAFTRVEFSLPRIANGDNSKLLSSQSQIDKALSKVQSLAAKICNTSSGFEQFRRVDLTLDFKTDPAAVIAAHRHCRYPGSTGEKYRSFSPYSACWEYSGRRFTLYDKGRERASAKGGAEVTSDILRVEIQLTSAPLQRLLGNSPQTYPSSLDFDRAYQGYRSEMLKFAPSVTVANHSNKFEALALMDAIGMEIHGQLPSELYTAHLKPRTRQSWRTEISKAHLALIDLDWEQILPPDHPPSFPQPIPLAPVSPD